MWFEVGTSSRSGPSSLSNQRSRRRSYAAADAPARRVERALELVQRDALLLRVPRDRVGLAGQLGLERLAGCEQLAPVVVERARSPSFASVAELVAVAVAGSTASFACAVRSGSSSPCQATRAARIRFSSSSSRAASSAAMRPRLARLAQPVEELALVAVRGLLGLAEHVELAGREEIAVALDDRRLLGDLLLADANGAPLLGALEQVAREALLVLGGGAGGGDAHDGETT